MENVILSIGSLQITAFSLCIMGAAAVSVAFLRVTMRGLGQDAWAVFAAWCLPLALLGARLFYSMARINYIVDLFGLDFVLRLWEGGYAFFGAVGGSALAGLIAAKRLRRKTAEVLNAAAPALLLMLALGRFAEGLGGLGYGPLVENPALQFFPFAVQNLYGEWNVAIFIAEGFTALIVLLLSLKRFKAHKALKSLIIIASTQIVWESMRRDMFLRWGFVRVSQVVAVLVLFALLIVLLSRRRRAGEKPSASAVPIAIFIVLTGGCIALEFAMDKSPFPYGWAWLIMTICAACMAALPWRLLPKAEER
ncbi:MAG TPA: prolipoprotein diacylglyceryl transferase [Candidatus Limiplasma sp.]|nr:prolipoprotein diacylglyceryl transferase [Candidatus Limiplasma sp.]